MAIHLASLLPYFAPDLAWSLGLTPMGPKVERKAEDQEAKPEEPGPKPSIPIQAQRL